MIRRPPRSTLSLHDALPICQAAARSARGGLPGYGASVCGRLRRQERERASFNHRARDRKSTRLNSSHGYISYAVFCLKKKIIGTGTLEVGEGSTLCVLIPAS